MLFDQKSQSGVNQANRAVVRVWMPKHKSQPVSAFKAVKKIQTGEEANVGHVALELFSKDASPVYVSLWPGESEEVTNVFKRYEASFSNLQEDKESEGGSPDYTICFYSLNISAIRGAFDQIKQVEGVGYILSGDSSLSEKNGQSCVSIVHRLLKEGGFSNLADHGSVSTSRIIKTPDEFCRLACEAKAEELKDYPDTREFIGAEGEYKPEMSSSCTIS